MKLNVTVAIPTVGRAAILCETLHELTLQTRAPDHTIVCGTNAADLAGVAAVASGIIELRTSPGLPRQRNALIEAASGADVLVFFDDDFLPHPDYLAEIERCMVLDPTIMVATGTVLADGIGGPGLTPEQGRAILAAAGLPTRAIETAFSGYGCNMAVRLAPMRTHDIRFDERLPLYGWQEDVDLSRRLAEFGRVVKLKAAVGVHLGVKSGRNSGLRLGYSQVANPLYLAGKRRGYPMGRAFTHIGRNLAMNIARAGWPETYVDRRGRLRGNLLALRDLLRGRMAPERVLDL